MAFGGVLGGLLSQASTQTQSMGLKTLAPSTSKTFTGGPPPSSSGFGGFLGSVVNSVKSVGGAAVHAAESFVSPVVKTIADFPVEAAKGIYHEGATVADLATGNTTAAGHQQQQLQSEQGKSYIGQEFGSHHPGDLSGIGHAIGFGISLATLGAGTLEGVAADTAEKEAAGGLVSKAAQAVTDNAKSFIGAGKTIGGTDNPLVAFGGKVARNLIFTQPTAQFAGKTVNDYASGNWKQAAIDTALWGIPGVAKLGSAAIGAVASKTGSAVFGDPAILNSVFGNGAVEKYLAAGGDPSVLKQIEGFTLNQSAVKGNVQAAGGWLHNYIDSNIPGLGEGADGVKQLVDNFKPYADEIQKLQAIQDAGGTITNEAGNPVPASALTVSHNFTKAIPAVKDAIDQAAADPQWSDLTFRLGVVKGVLGKLGIADDTLNRQIANTILTGEDSAAANTALDTLFENGQKNIVKDLGNGFVLTSAPSAGAARMPSAEEVASKEIIKGSNPSAVGNALTKAGLSPRATTPGAFNASLQDNLEKRFAENGIAADAKTVLNKLQDKAATVSGASDVRMLSAKQVEETIGSTPAASAKIVLKSVRQAYGDIPASVVGAGPKIVNKVMNPLLAKYLQVQGSLKFEGGNPISNLTSLPFRAVKIPLKGAVVAAGEGGDVMSTFIGGSKDTVSLLKQDTEAGWFSGNRAGGSGTISDELGNSISSGKMVGKGLQHQISGLVESVARSNGTTPEAIINEKGALYDQLKESVSLIKGYGTGGYLNSPLAKSLNLVIFPSRFDTKVIESVAKIMGKMSVSQQIGTVVALNNLHGFVSSPQGKQWMQQNADLVKLISYFTPVETFSGVMSFLKPGNGFHLQDLGQLGGLPFGVISTVIGHQGLDLGHLGSSQYFDPATGKPIPSAIPTTLKARGQTFASDILASMFSYPGESVGLNSKAKEVQGIVPAIKPAKTEVQYRYANGSTEGSPNAPQPKPTGSADSGTTPTSATPSPTRILPKAPKAPTISTPSPSFVKPAKTKKVVAASAQLPGSSNFAAQ